MSELGRIALLLALIIAVYSAVAAVVGARRGYRELIQSAVNGVYAVGGLVTLASLALLWSLIARDFRVQYVYQYTSVDLPLPYTISAFWAGQEGSLLFWGWVLAIFSAIAVWQARNRHRQLMPYVAATLMTVQAFFIFLSTFASSVFVQLAWAPGDGHGLNPLLENPGMVIHPPAVFLGYVAFSVPFAYAVAALVTGRLGDEWIRTSRSWAVLAWLCLGLGNLLGAQWAYVELGWGGYWAWDPVENGSLLPWLTGTALLHSMVMQRRRGIFKVWSFALVMTTFSLSILGTFLVRSGIVSSVHSFGESSIGVFFLTFLGLTVLVSFALLTERWSQLKDDQPMESLVSKESSFLLTNLIFVGLAFVVFWGTMFPALAEGIFGRKVTIGAAFFNQVTPPIFLTLLVLMGICPLIMWRRNSVQTLTTTFRYPAAATVAFAVIIFALGVRQGWALLAFSVCAFIAASTVLDWARGVAARRRATGEGYLQAFALLTWKNRPRYGGYLVHLGVALVALGVAGSSLYHAETEVALARGESASIQGYSIKYEGMTQYETPSKQVKVATVEVYRDGQLIDRMVSESIFHRSFEQPVTEVGIRTTLLEDLYLILAGWEQNGEIATFKILVNGLVVWLWIGSGVLLLGGVLAFWPGARTTAMAARERTALSLRTGVEE